MKLAFLFWLAGSLRAESNCILVNRSSVTAGDLTTAIPEFGAVSASRHLAWAPVPGLVRWLKAAELQKVAIREGVLLPVGVSVCVQRRTVVFTEDQVIAALRERLPAGSELHVSDYCRLPLMSGRLRFDAKPSTGPPGENHRLLWKGAVVGDDQRTVPFWASVQVRINQQVVRATRSVPANTILSSEALAEDTEQIASIDTGPMPRISDLVGKETTRNLEHGQVIRLSWIRAPFLVRKGQTVRVTVESGKAVLALDARALNGGNQGDTILIKNDENGRTFRAEITGPGNASIRTGGQIK